MKPEEVPANGVNILYFARLSEQLGCREEALALPDKVATIGALRDFLSQRGEPWTALRDSHIRLAVNQEIVKADAPLKAGDEVAFFPPVTGG